MERTNKTKESQCFEIKILCMFVGEKNKGERQNLNFGLEGNGTVESHIYAHAQLSESNVFQSTVKVENKEGLIHDDDQEQKEVKEGQSKGFGAKEKEQILCAAIKEEDDIFLQSMGEGQNLCFVEEDGGCHEVIYDDYETHEGKYELLQHTKLINLLFDKDDVQKRSCLGGYKEMTVCHMGRSGKKASPHGSKPAKEQREVKIENGVHLANAYSGIKEKGQSLKTIVVEDRQEDEQLLRVVSQIEEEILLIIKATC